MTTAQQDILKALETMTLRERLEIVESVLQEIRARLAEDEAREDRWNNLERRMRDAAVLLADDYKNDEELTIFSALDGEDFLDPE
jgi:ferredoxin-fold anticodon binding domain-containing protein